MAKFYVFFITVDREKLERGGGWGSLEGQAYLNATTNATPLEAILRGMYEPAAVVELPGVGISVERVWRMMQNLENPWTDTDGLLALTEFPRSAMVGDILYDVNADQWAIVASIGFEPIWQIQEIEALNPILDNATRMEHARVG